ncbi:Spy/CpxP family protein refolding chaperone [Hyphomicrobium sp.]|jgi:hypothetical protein|uniref:Spy/CpxP family protein refolding chaperone n=1 Tax=Hyphomicrobium sp. TaxID=82 RepID=UPI002CD58747|nr:Spy/CpxP family protein refolding chaperone [Hyphomicrobium sp.]HVZ03476.1 Spy/CpxP family protein refolding chaperone [Hyphomicrobium sp.]
MNSLSRGTWLALAAVVAVPATVAIAKTTDRMGWRMTPETRSRLEDGRIAMVKTALQLTPDQEKLWAPVETSVRDNFKAREEKRAEWAKKRQERRAARAAGEKHEHKRPDLAERYDRMSQRLSERAEKMKSFATAFKPFYASLSDEQKDVLRPLMHQLRPGFGGHHHRPHWAFGGWGPGGGPGRDHGWGHHGWRGGHGRPNGPGMQNEAPEDHGGPEAPAEPDKKG